MAAIAPPLRSPWPTAAQRARHEYENVTLISSTEARLILGSRQPSLKIRPQVQQSHFKESAHSTQCEPGKPHT